MPAGRCQLLSSKRGESSLSNSPHLVGQLEQNSLSGDALGYVTGAQFMQVTCLRLIWWGIQTCFCSSEQAALVTFVRLRKKC